MCAVPTATVGVAVVGPFDFFFRAKLLPKSDWMTGISTKALKSIYLGDQ